MCNAPKSTWPTEAKKRARYWLGDVPEQCDLKLGFERHGAHSSIGKVFVDGRTRGGPWAIMCENCHQTQGVGLGQDYGQKYEKQEDGKWLKTAG